MSGRFKWTLHYSASFGVALISNIFAFTGGGSERRYEWLTAKTWVYPTRDAAKQGERWHRVATGREQAYKPLAYEQIIDAEYEVLP